jgi:hypothetical protein
MDFREKIDKILEDKQIKLYKLAEISGLGNTLEKAYEENREMRTSTTERFLQKLGINTEWWETQNGNIYVEKHASVPQAGENKLNGMHARETFYQDLIEKNDEYSLLPRAVLRDYKIVPDKIIDVLVQSNENEKKALIESKELEIRVLNEKYEILIEGYENKIKRLEKENDDLRGRKIS